MNSTREFVIGKLSTLLDVAKDDKICTDLEKCILNHSHDKCHSQPAWDNPCLLYTSPSPRDRTRSRMPSSA